MNLLQENLGNVMSTQDVALYLGIDVKTVRKHYSQLGGIRLGRSYRFFERRMIDAIQDEKWPIQGSGEAREISEGKSISDEEGGTELGEHDEAEARQRLEREDRHNLLG